MEKGIVTGGIVGGNIAWISGTVKSCPNPKCKKSHSFVTSENVIECPYCGQKIYLTLEPRSSKI